MDNGDILRAIAELKTDMISMETRLKSELRSDMSSMEERLREYVHDTETRIVGEFYKWARSTETRMRTTEVNILPMIERMSAMEARLLDVEQRLNLPPQH